MTEYFTLETDFILWSAAITGLAYLENMMKRSEGFGELYDRLGFQEVEGEKKGEGGREAADHHAGGEV